MTINQVKSTIRKFLLFYIPIRVGTLINFIRTRSTTLIVQGLEYELAGCVH